MHHSPHSLPPITNIPPATRKPLPPRTCSVYRKDMRLLVPAMRPAAKRHALTATLLLATTALSAQTALQQQVASIAQAAQGTVNVSCVLPGTALNCDLHPHSHPPMQSMFKYPLSLTVLHLAETGKLFPNSAGEPIDKTLDRTVRYLPQDRIPKTFSPLQDRYPDGNVDVTLRELITLTAGQSDNVGSEILLRIAGGPAAVQAYIRSIVGTDGFQLTSGEQFMDTHPNAQYDNWMEPAAAARLLQRLVTDPPLKPATNAFLLQVLTESKTGPNRLRAGLPPGTPLAHKTGTSGFHDGKAAATNDVGLITLPDGRHLAVAVYVTDARANEATREAVIANIAKAAYTAALKTP